MEFLFSWFHSVKRKKSKQIATKKEAFVSHLPPQIEFLRYVKKQNPIGVSGVHLNLSNTHMQIFQVQED